MTGEHTTSWEISPEWGFPDSLVLWLTIDGWTFPTRLQHGTVNPMLLPLHAPAFLPKPLPPIDPGNWMNM